MAWLQSNLPRTLAKMNREQQHVKHLFEESETMEQELENERHLNKELQEQIAQRRQKNDEMCALATILRSETEAVLSRYVYHADIYIYICFESLCGEYRDLQHHFGCACIVYRHNILLDTPEARAVAQDLHSKAAAAAKKKQVEKDTEASEQGDSEDASQNDDVPDSVKVTADLDHDGDDEGDDEEEQGDEMFD